jgi:hypothetical protein
MVVVVENMATSQAVIFYHWMCHLLKTVMNYLLLLLTFHVSRMTIFHLEKVIFFLLGAPFIPFVVSLSTIHLFVPLHSMEPNKARETICIHSVSHLLPNPAFF